MKIFISWSGNLSHRIALKLKELLPLVFNILKSYVSSKDIKGGEQWFEKLMVELNSSTYGIICLSRENIREPWLLFEAGTLSSGKTRDKIIPFLIDVHPSDLIGIPLSGFQAITINKDDVFKMLSNFHSYLENNSLITQQQLEESFELWWPKFDESIKKILNTNKTTKNNGGKDYGLKKDRMILEEILKNSRSILQQLESSSTEEKSSSRDIIGTKVIIKDASTLSQSDKIGPPTWISEMDQYSRAKALITGYRGWGYTLDIDDGKFVWDSRWLKLVTLDKSSS